MIDRRVAAIACLVAAVVLFSALLVVKRMRQPVSTFPSSSPIVTAPIASSFELAARAFRANELVAAEQYIREALIEQGDAPEVLTLAARIFAKGGDADQAAEFYQRSVSQVPEPPLPLLDEWGRLEMERGRPFEALAILRQAVEMYPDHPPLRRDIAGLLASLGQQPEAGEHLRWLAQRGHAGPSELTMLADLTRPQTDEAICDYALERFPDDPLPLVAKAKRDAYFGRWKDVRDKTNRARAAGIMRADIEALYSRALAELNEVDAWYRWHKNKPAKVEELADYWIGAGVLANRQSELEYAAFCFWKAASLQDDNIEAIGQLVACLGQLGVHQDWQQRLTARQRRLMHLRELVDRLAAEGYRSQDAIVQVAKELDQLGRLWEAAAWLRVGAVIPNPSSELVSLYESIRQRLDSKTPWLLASSRIVDQKSLEDYSEEPSAWLADADSSDTNIDPVEMVAPPAGTYHFVDQAIERGVDHVCKIAKPDGEEADLWIHQSIVGGAAVIDYDLNGWPDLYFTNANGLPYQTDSDANQLFRNHDGSFTRVTDFAAVGDRGLAQGVTVGDYNADGFPDLFVANIGTNRLLRNNGDGTFTDATTEVGIRGERWTTSVAALDIDLDGHLDLYEVGYCSGLEPFEQKCSRDGFTRSCSPVSFRAEPDRVWRGTGDGRFEDVSARWLEDQQPSYGLALLAGFFDDAPGVDIYVGNDMAANHFWSSTPGETFRLEEQASVRGVAVDARSLSQASMGMTVADADQDGDFDFFLTHHASESNTYYEQIRPGIWADHTARVDLRDSSIAMLGFGTAWFDFDNNGQDELLVCNGHVDDFAHLDEPYRMPMQAYRRLASGRWSLVPSTELGPPFEQARLARCLVTADVNRDGVVDAVVTHLFDPVSLLISQPTPRHSSLTLHVRGSAGQRDAIGTTVTIEIDGEKRTRQLIAGDGFHGSCERCIRFGVGDASHVDHVHVRWPSGDVVNLGTLKAGHEYLVIEGDSVPFSFDEVVPVR